MNGYIELVAVGVLEVQKLGRDAAGFERCESEVPADAVFLVNDGRSGCEIAELPDDGFRVAVTPAPPLPGMRAFSKQLLFADNGNARPGKQHPVLDRRHGHADAVCIACELAPAVDPNEVEPAAAQHVEELLTATRRIGGEHDPAVEVVGKVQQRGGSVLIPGLDLHRRRHPRIEIRRDGILG